MPFKNVYDGLVDDEDAEMEGLFNRGQVNDNESDLVEIIQIPIVNEVTASDNNLETDKVDYNDLEGDILPWMVGSDLQSEGSKKNLIYLSREEAEKMFA